MLQSQACGPSGLGPEVVVKPNASRCFSYLSSWSQHVKKQLCLWLHVTVPKLSGAWSHPRRKTSLRVSAGIAEMLGARQ